MAILLTNERVNAFNEIFTKILTKTVLINVLILWTITQSIVFANNNDVWFDKNIHQENRIEVKFMDDSPIKYSQGKLIVTNNSTAYKHLIDSFNRTEFIKWQPIFSIEENTLKQWRTTAQKHTDKPAVDLSQFYYLHLSGHIDTADIIAQLRQSSLIAGAYPVNKPIEPPLPPDYETSSPENIDPTYGNMYQRYFDAAPDGMDIIYARDGVGGTGSGIDICNVEYGYLAHNDLGTVTNLRTPTTTLQPNFYQHGTAVLGMLNSKNNGWGTTGLIYDSGFYFSPAVAINQNYNLAAAISFCINQLNPGDIILIEQQTTGQDGNFVPSEWVPSVYAIVQTAVNNGYIVVAAAGNGNENLDDSFYSTALPGHAPFTSGNDSGAIIVGAASSPWTTNPRTRMEFSTYGSTVDLHGWGHDTIAPSYGSYYSDDGVLLDYTLFSGTSGASPMVVAAAAILQANYIAKYSANAAPNIIKQLLISTGAAQENVNGENIGPFPNLRAAINAVWNVTSLDAPIITPSSGVFSPPIDVTIGYGSVSQNSSNTHIRYTLDGSEPTIDSFIYIPEQADSIFLLYSANVKATAFQSSVTANRVFASATTSADINLIAPQVATPVISPNGGAFTQGMSLVITTSTPGATIKYRTDGRSPSLFYSGTTYNGPFNLAPGSYNFTAKAYKDGLYKSDTFYANQLTITPISLPPPTLFPNSGVYSGQVTVYIGSTVLGAVIRYTTDGSEPNAASTIYENAIFVDNTATVKAKAFLSGYSPSNTVSNSYTIINQVSTPVFSPNSGATANDNMFVTISSTTNDATIRYTTNGTDPVETSTIYTSAINLTAGQHILKARSYLSGASFSNVSTANYIVYDSSNNVSPPIITPPGGILNGPVTVSMYSDTEGVSLIFYTTDGTDPATSSTFQVYNGPFELQPSANTYFIRARAFLSGSGNSNIAPATLTIVNPVSGPVATPTMTPEPGEYNNSITVSVQAPDYSPPFNIRRLFVTRDGDVPTADLGTSGNGSGGVYNFSLAKPETVKALSAQAGWFDSAIMINDYAFKCATPVISTGGTFVGSTNVNISTITSSASIYYTVDGSDPTTSDMQYNSPFNVSSDQVVKAMCTRNNFTQSDTVAEVFLILAVQVAPTITIHPQAQMLDTCDSTTLSVASTGTSPLSYQWYKNGNVVAGATEIDLELLEVNALISGNYHVVVSNNAGSVASNIASVIVPIFASGFEVGESSNTCDSKTNVSKSNSNHDILSNTDKSKFANNEILKTDLDGMSVQILRNNNAAVSDKLNHQSTKGKPTPDVDVVIIPTLNTWMKLLLVMMFLAFAFYRRLYFDSSNKSS